MGLKDKIKSFIISKTMDFESHNIGIEEEEVEIDVRAEYTISLRNSKRLEDLFDDFNHPNPNINEKAYLEMIRYWPNESMKELLELLQNDDLIIRRKSIEALSKFGEEIFAPIVNSNKI